MHMKILITGVQNSVEESIVKLALEHAEGKAKFKILSFSDFVDTGESAADELKLLKSTQKKIKDNIEMRILKSRAGDNIIINGYFTVKSKLGFFPVISRDVIDTFNPDFLVHIHVDPLALAGKLDNRKEFDEHQDIENSCAVLIGAYAGCGIKIIRSGVDGTRESADELYGILKELMVDK